MKAALLFAFCYFLIGTVAAQVKTPETNVGVEEILLARDDGSGQAGETTDRFLTTDTPIYCFVQLDSFAPATVKLILVAVKAEGLKPETKSLSVSYTTNGRQNQVNFNAAPETVWAAGSYRADIFINGKSAGSRNFEIEKSPQLTEQIKTTAPKSFVSRKPVRKSRKN